ncbi:MAG: TauD/TfdA family dioxygenase, partial [Planctomycetales bacterium]|nr:TauD/TfdA family dioxygenase [Planctomycetales bacterium]
SLPQLEWIFWALASLVGTPVSQSAAGERVFHVRDERFGEQDARTRGPNTNKQLSFHTDRCDVIGFLCVMPAASGGENQIVSSVGLFNDIAIQRPDLLETLMSPYLYQRHNVDLNHPSRHIEQPIFAIHEGHFAANLLRVLIERAYAADDTPDMTPRQREALDYLEQLADQPERRLEFRQERGDLVLLNNFVTLHRRSAFRDDPTPHLRRHLLRIWLSVPNSRPLDPRFAGNYGDTTAGALRGGMRGPS